MMIETLRASHGAFADRASEPGWLHDRRVAALARFTALGLPGSHLEAWKYTSTKAMAAPAFAHAAAPDLDVEPLIAPHRLAHAVAELVFVDGVLARALSRFPAAPGVEVASVADVLRDQPEVLRERLGRLVAWNDEAFTALNVAFLQDGLSLKVGRGVSVDGPVHVIAVGTPAGGPTIAHLHHLVEIDDGARVTLVETLVGQAGDPVLTNAVVELHVGANAELTHVVTGLQPDTAHLVHTIEARLQRDARLHSHLVWLGGAVTRSNVHVVHAGAGGHVDLLGLYVLDGAQHVDNHTVVDHVAPHTTTRESYKGVLGGHSKGIFDGLVVVRSGAHKTDSVQSCRNLLVSPDADVNAKPTLEIYDDDVKCGHGTTVGQLDPVQLGYLRSRGIPVDEARRMLTAAFVADLVDQVADVIVREQVRGAVERHLSRVQEA